MSASMPARALLGLLAVALVACAPRSEADFELAARQHVWRQYFSGGAARDAVIACIGEHAPESAAQLNMVSSARAPDRDAMISEFRSVGEASVYSMSQPAAYVVRVTQPIVPQGGEATSVSACCPREASPLCGGQP